MGRISRFKLKNKLTKSNSVQHHSQLSKLDIEDLTGFYEAFAALAATIFAVPLNDISDAEYLLGPKINSSCVDIVQPGAFADGFEAGDCKQGPTSVSQFLVVGLIQWGLMCASYVVVLMARRSHISLYWTVTDVNVSLFGLNCLELLLLSLIPLSFGTFEVYTQPGEAGTSTAIFVGVCMVLQIMKILQALYITYFAKDFIIREGAHLGITDDLCKSEYESDSNQPNPVALYQIHVHIVTGIVKLFIYALTITLGYLIDNSYALSVMVLLFFANEPRVAKIGGMVRRSLASKRFLSDGSRDNCSAHAMQSSNWLKWRKKKVWSKERWIIFRDGVYGFLVTAVVLNVTPADSFDEQANTIYDYIAENGSYINAYVAVGAAMLAIYTMSYLTTRILQEDILFDGYGWLGFALNSPLVLSVFVPYLALLSVGLDRRARYDDSSTVGTIFFGWILAIALIMEFGWIIIIQYRADLARDMSREDASAVLAYGFTLTLMSILGLLFVPFFGLVASLVVLYGIPLEWKLVDYFLTERLMSLVWKKAKSIHHSEAKDSDCDSDINTQLHAGDAEIEMGALKSAPTVMSNTLEEPLLQQPAGEEDNL